MMEHRQNMRLPLRMELWVEFPGHSALSVCTHDVSLRGTFIETPPEVPPNAIVRLIFRDEQNDGLLEIPAVITRRHQHGMGLMYGNLNTSMQRRLQALLNRDNNLLDTQTAVV